MKFDLDGATQLLGQVQMLAIRGKLKVRFMLSELDGVPPMRLFETWKPHIRDTCLFGSKEVFESLTQSIREHLNGRSRNVFPTTSKLLVQIVLRGKGAIVLILCLESCKHLVVDVARLDQALHEQVGLLFIRIDSVLKRLHALHFIGGIR